MFDKIGFCMSVRPCLRNILQHSHVQLQAARTSGAARIRWTAARFEEALMGCLFLPAAEMNLGYRFSRHIFCSDAAPGGHGICHRVADLDKVGS